jgi:hypothetical protein
MSCSWYWFKADAPQARSKTAPTTGKTPVIWCWGPRKYPVAAEAAANVEILARQRVRYVFKDDMDNDPIPDKPKPKGQNLKASRAKTQRTIRKYFGLGSNEN